MSARFTEASSTEVLWGLFENEVSMCREVLKLAWNHEIYINNEGKIDTCKVGCGYQLEAHNQAL